MAYFGCLIIFNKVLSTANPSASKGSVSGSSPRGVKTRRTGGAGCELQAAGALWHRCDLT